jgi:predicted GTPase
VSSEGFAYRLIDTAGSELAIVNDPRSEIGEGESIELPDADVVVVVVETYDDETGREGGVQATLVVDVDG